jgi:hypothetical protein
MNTGNIRRFFHALFLKPYDRGMIDSFLDAPPGPEFDCAFRAYELAILRGGIVNPTTFLKGAMFGVLLSRASGSPEMDKIIGETEEASKKVSSMTPEQLVENAEKVKAKWRGANV